MVMAGGMDNEMIADVKKAVCAVSICTGSY
jgi:hypothetical protein